MKRVAGGDYNRLRGRIIEKYGSQGGFAKALNTTEQTITGKLTGKTQFSQSDIIRWCDALDITAASVGRYFFAGKLSKR